MSRSVSSACGRGVTLKDRRVSWRTVPTFAAGALATAAGAVLVWCCGAARADSAVTDWMLRWWARGGGWASTALSMSARPACVVLSNHRSRPEPLPLNERPVPDKAGYA
jgi:hypothetical protein